MHELGVIIPTLNDADTLPHTVERLHAVVGQSGIATELVLVDGGSTDATVDVASGLVDDYSLLHGRVLVRARSDEPLGYGSMVRYGLAYSTARYCALVAAEGTDPVDMIPEMVRELRAQRQLVICSRYSERAGSARVSPRFRWYQSVYRKAIHLGLGLEIADSTNGFRAFDRKYVQALGLSSNRFSVCPEITFKVLLSGGETAFVAGQPEGTPGQVAPKFALPHEIAGYAYVLARAVLHRLGLRWF
ncbi:MAG: glycosyltransferase family 2 protein [Acidimicrobiia bacterium]